MADDMKIKIRSVIELVETLNRSGQTEKFVQKMEADGAFITVAAATVDAVKLFFSEQDHLLNSPFGQTIGITINTLSQRPDPGCQGGHCGHTI